MGRVPLVHARLNLGRQRHRVVEVADGRNLPHAEEGEERHRADLVLSAPSGRDARVDPSAAFPNAADGGIQRRRRAGVGGQVVAAQVAFRPR